MAPSAASSGRQDVVLPGDLALRKAVRVAYRLDHLPSQGEVLSIAEKWRPYRSLATAYLFSAAFGDADDPGARDRLGNHHDPVMTSLLARGEPEPVANPNHEGERRDIIS